MLVIKLNIAVNTLDSLFYASIKFLGLISHLQYLYAV